MAALGDARQRLGGDLHALALPGHLEHRIEIDICPPRQPDRHDLPSPDPLGV
jgi:hypothetical protein